MTRVRRGGLRGVAGAAATVFGVLIWAQLSPRPAVVLIRVLFSLDDTGAADPGIAPDDVTGVEDLAYGDGPDEVLDIWYPDDADEPLPVVVWIHGGAWVSGDKSDPAPYLKMLASHGYVGVAINYSLAPGTNYPVPLEQTDRALAWVVQNASEHHVDPTRIVLAGDSAGSHIAGQYAAMVSDAGYAREVGFTPAIEPEQLRGTVLHCGPYDPPATIDASGVMGWFVRTVGWAYLGTRDLTSPLVKQASVTDHATAGYPPTLLTGGDADGLTVQGRAFAARLGELGVDHEAYWYPGLGHEFQFDMDLTESVEVAEATVAFLDRVTG